MVTASGRSNDCHDAWGQAIGLVPPVIPVTQNGTDFLVGVSGGKGGADHECKCGGINAVPNPNSDPRVSMVFPFVTNTNTLGFETGIEVANPNAPVKGTVTIFGATTNGGSSIESLWHVDVPDLI